MTSNRWNYALIILGLLFTAAAVAPPAHAQIVTVFTKDDCHRWNNVCNPGENCDDVTPPRFFPTQTPRTCPPAGTGQIRLSIQNDGAPKTGLTLEDIMPECYQVSCNPLCVDSDCDTVPDAGPVYVESSDPSTTDPVAICEGPSPGRGGRVALPPFDLAPDETMDLRFCGEYVLPGMCCNQAVLDDGVRQQLAVDGIDPAAPEELCVDVGGSDIPFWKDDCDANRTGDPAGCDDVGTTPLNERAVNPPADGKRVMWVLHVENPAGSLWSEFQITDDMSGTNMYVSCAPGDWVGDPAWGCFEASVDGVPRQPAGTCSPGLVNSGIDTTEPVPVGSTLEIRFCAVLQASHPEYCNNNAELRTTSPPNIQRSPTDNLDSDFDICIIGDPPQLDVSADKSVVNLTGGSFPAAPGETVQYTIAICETSGLGDVTIDFTDPIPGNIVNAALDPGAPAGCQIAGGNVICPGLVITAGNCAPDIIWQGEVDCTGLAGGDPICNQGTVDVTDPPPGGSIPTNDPNTPAANDPTCFALGLDDLSTSTKEYTLTDNDGDTVESCGDVLNYTITVNSTGLVDATNVNLSDVIDPAAGGVYVADSTFVDGIQVSPDPYDSGTNSLSLALGDRPTGGNPVVITFDVTLADLGTGPYTFCNQAFMTTSDTLACGAPPYATDDPGTPATGDATCADVTCGAGGPDFAPVDKQVLDDPDPAVGNVVTTAQPDEIVWYHIDWCNNGNADANDVQFEDVLPPCVELDQAAPPDQVVSVDGSFVADPFSCGGPPDQICFDVDPLMNPSECHHVVIQVRVTACPEGTDVSNTATVRSLEIAGEDSDPAAGGVFTIAAPSGEDLRRSDTLDDLWNDAGCNPVNPRLNDTRNIASPAAWPECDIGRGGITGARTLEFYEAVGNTSCDFTLQTVRTDCDGDPTTTDIEVQFQ